MRTRSGLGRLMASPQRVIGWAAAGPLLAVLAIGGCAATGAPDATPAAAASSPAASIVATPAATSTGSPAASTGSGGVPVPGERIAFGVRAGETWNIFSVLPDGTDQRQLTSGPGNSLCAAFFPDAREIAYCGDASGAFEIWTMEADGTKQAQLTKLGGKALFPDVSPDGAKIAFGGTEGSDPNTEIYVVDAATGSGLVALTSCANGKAGCANDYPAWSPDGKQIVFVHQDDIDASESGINQQVWVMNADGSHAHALTTGPEPKDQLPDWSPDGTSIAYVSGTRDNEGIWVMRADGSKPRQISGCVAGDAKPCAAGDDFGPAWSPDSTSIAFARDYGAIGKDDRPIFVMHADGTDQRRVLPDPMRAGVPAWR
jgi:Tol biopolymer transport system component